MADSNDAETEEKLTYIHVRLYHPRHADCNIFRNIDCTSTKQHQTCNVLEFGRYSSCSYVLHDQRASRWQFALQVYRHFNRSELIFEVKNLSMKTKLYVDNVELDHLNKTQLPSKCMIRFGEYLFSMEKEAGESVEKFEICFEITLASPMQEIPVAPSLQPIQEHGIMNTVRNSSIPFSREETAEEDDENT